MDSKSSIPFAINNLQDLLGDDATTKNPRHKKLVQKSIDNLCTLKQFLKGVDDLPEAPSGGPMNDRRNTVRLLKAVHSMENAADTFVIMKKYSQHVQNREQQEQQERDLYNDDKFLSYLAIMWLCCFTCCYSSTSLKNLADTMKYYGKRLLFIYKLKSFHRWILFSRKMKKFNDEIRRLVDMKGPAGSTLDIGNDDNTWLLSVFGSQWQHWGRISGFCLEEETQLVGLQQHINELTLQLIPQSMINRNVGPSSVDEISEEQQQLNPTDMVISTQVIAVVGEGGSGKTTLARCVYDSIDVKKNFTNRAWVRVPSAFKARDVFVDILEQINQPGVLADATLSESAMMRRITNLLNGTRFLIVLENINLIDHVLESLIANLSPPSHQDGRIIIITRNIKDCLTTSVAHSTINICRLNDKESWNLFSKKVRIEEDELNHSELITFKERIVNICGGLPLVIGLLGGLLSTKAKSCDEWTKIVSMLANKTSEDVMALCYQDLPIEVKPCFLYLGVFPKGFDIPVRRLILLWLAEGFLTPPELHQEIDPEDLAEICIEELITRNMVEVRWRLDGSPKTCCLSSDVYDFVSSKAANVGFSFHHQVTFSKYKKSPVRRLVANVGIQYFINPLHGLHHLRSYLAFDNRVRITSARDVDILFNKIISDKGFGVLRLLDLEGVFKPTLSDQVIGKLLLVSYLGLRSTFIECLPHSVGQLPYLETLDLRHTDLNGPELPELRTLRHIYLNFQESDLVYRSFSTNLRTLWGLKVSLYNFRQDLSKIRKIKKLGLTCDGDIEELSLRMADWIDQLTELQYLKFRSVKWRVYPASIKLRSLTKHQMLQELYLLGNLPQSVVDVGFLPPNLRKLTLSESGLKEDPMPKLGELPHLHILRLYSKSYKGEQMTCLSNGFPKLKLLKLWKIPVGEWTLEEGAMPCLKELEIRSCENLKLPQGLQYVTTLKELVLTNMPTNFGAAIEEILKHGHVYIKNNTWTSHP